MHFVIEKDQLAKAIGLAGRIAQGKLASPSSSNILMSLEGSQLQLWATDLDLTLSTVVEVGDASPGALVVPARLVSEIARALPPGKVEVSRSGEHLVLSAGRSTYEVMYGPAEEFPMKSWPLASIVGVDVDALATAVGQVARCAASDEVRPVLTGVMMEQADEGLRLVATDTYRLGIRTLESVMLLDKGKKVVVPARALDEAVRIAAANGASTLGVALHSDAIEFHIGPTILRSQLIADPFVDYTRAIPSELKFEIVASRQELLEALRRIRVMVRDHSSSVRVSPAGEGEVELTVAAADVGKGREVLEAELKGEPEVIAFNPSYLIDGVDAIKDERVVLKVAGRNSPALIEGEKDKHYWYLLSPIRIP
jgi:DNA polymerase-3 subunit beta